jgi:hypothetical protein
MSEFGDIFANGLTTAVYVYGSVIMLAGYGLFMLWLRRPAPVAAPREAFGLS